MLTDKNSLKVDCKRNTIIMEIRGEETIQKYVRIGQLGVLIIGLVLGIIWLTKKYEIFQQQEEVYYIRTSSEELQLESRVLINAYEAGRISRVESIPITNEMLYEFRLAKRFSIPVTANFSILFDTLESKNQLEIFTGLSTQPLELIEQGDTIDKQIHRSYGEVSIDSLDLIKVNWELRKIENSLNKEDKSTQIEKGLKSDEQDKN